MHVLFVWKTRKALHVQNISDKFGRKLNKIWVDKVVKFHNK